MFGTPGPGRYFHFPERHIEAETSHGYGIRDSHFELWNFECMRGDRTYTLLCLVLLIVQAFFDILCLFGLLAHYADHMNFNTSLQRLMVLFCDHGMPLMFPFALGVLL